MKIESNKNWTTCLRLNTGDGSPRVFLFNSHFLGSVPDGLSDFYILDSDATYMTKCNTQFSSLLNRIDALLEEGGS